tara:strand:+ start:61 stop:918 length:858 start_codon:yes stop_codon:yes gene_type:complete
MSKYSYIAEVLKQNVDLKQFDDTDIEQQAEDLTNDMKTILTQMLASIKENNERQKDALDANVIREEKRDEDEKERRLSPDGTTAAEAAEELRENQKRTKEEVSAYKRNLKNLDSDRKNKTTDDKLRGSKLQQFLGTQGSPKPRKKKEKTVSVWEKGLQSQRKRRQKIKENKLYVENKKLMQDRTKPTKNLTSYQDRIDMEGFEADEKEAAEKKREAKAAEDKAKAAKKLQSDIEQVKTIQGKREKQAGKTDAKIRRTKAKRAKREERKSEDSEDMFWFNQVIKIV